MKKTFSIFLLICIFFSGLVCTPVNAETAVKEGNCGAEVTWHYDGIDTLTIKGTGPMYDFSYAYSYWEYNGCYVKNLIIEEGVTTIGEYAFMECSDLENVVIPSSITEIKFNAFTDCTSLKSVALPQTAITIEGYAFENCDSLTNVQIYENTIIAGTSFVSCDNLESYIVSEENSQLCSVDGVLFSKDKSVLLSYPSGKSGTYYKLPESVSEIGICAFSDNRYVTTIDFTDNVTNVAYKAFYNSQISSVTLGENITSIGEHAFSMCNNLTEVTVNASVAGLGSHMFASCKKLKNVKISEGIKSIGNNAFYGCNSMENLELPESLERLSDQAFFGCHSLKKVELGKAVNQIDYDVFDCCSSLESIVIPEENSVYTVYDGVVFSKDMKRLQIYPEGIKREVYTVPDGTNYIDKNAFSYAKMKSIIYPSSVVSIGSTAMKSCINLESITVTENLDYISFNSLDQSMSDKVTINFIGHIADWEVVANYEKYENFKKVFTKTGILTGKCGDNAQWSYDHDAKKMVISGTGEMTVSSMMKYPFTSAVIGEGITALKSSAFAGSEHLTSITVPDNVTVIEEGAFYSSGIESIKLPSGITKISGRTFDDCVNLKSITIPDGVTEIGINAFDSCSSLKEVNLPESVIRIDTGAFNYCTALEEITLPSKLEYMNFKIFSDCTSLKKVIIGGIITEINEGTFEGCTALESVTMPDTVELIGRYAFKDCSSLKTISIPENVVTFGTNAFNGCENLTTVYFGGTEANWLSINGLENAGLGNVEVIYAKTEIQSGVCGTDAQWTFDETTRTLTITGNGNFARSGWDRYVEIIEKIVIGEGITALPDSAFKECVSLKSVTIPESVTNIGTYVFKDSTLLETVYYNGTKTDWFTVKNASHPYGYPGYEVNKPSSAVSYKDPMLNAEIVFAKSGASAGSCGEAVNWKFDIDTGVVEVYGSGATYDFTYSTSPFTRYGKYFKKIVIGEGITYIGKSCFCFAADTIEIPSTLTSVGSDGFSKKYNTAKYPLSRVDWNLISGISKVNVTNVDCAIDKPHTGTYGNGFTWEVNGDYTLTLKGTGAMPEYPSNNVENAPWYKYRSVINNIVIEEGITKIPQRAFYKFSWLESVSLPSTLETVSEYAFYYCDDLASVTLSDGIKYIDDAAFMYTGLKTAVIPKSVISVGSSAFFGCKSLTTVTINRNLKSIGVSAFASSALKKVYYQGSATEFEQLSVSGSNAAFDNAEKVFVATVIDGICGDNVSWSYDTESCKLIISGSGRMYDYSSSDLPGWQEYMSKIKSVTIHSGVTYIGVFAFANCEFLESADIASSVTEIGTSAFYNCYMLTDVKLRKGTVTVGRYAFYNCEALTTLKLPETVSTLGNSALRNCSSLESVLIPLSVKEISTSTFQGCKSLKTVYYGGTEKDYSQITVGTGNESLSGATFVFKTTEDVVHTYDDDTKTLTINGFNDMKDFTSSNKSPWNEVLGEVENVVISEGVSTIGNRAFTGAENVKEITLPSTVTEIGSYAFMNCDSLETVNIPAVSVVGSNVFNGCTNLKTINVYGTKEEYKNMLNSAGSSNLVMLRADKTITEPDGNVLHGGMSIYATWLYDTEGKTLEIDNCPDVNSRDMLNYKNETSVPWNEYINDIETVEINGVSKVGSRTMISADSLKSASVGDTVTAINSWAFFDCSALENVTLSANVKSVGTGAFNGVDSLKSITAEHTIEEYSKISFGKSNDRFQKIKTILSDGACGTHSGSVKWSYSNGVLTLSGKGSMASVPYGMSESSPSAQPWYDYRDEITQIYISEGITFISKFAFSGLSNVAEISIPESVTQIGTYAFSDMIALNTLRVTNKLSKIGTGAFNGCSNLKKVIYDGSKSEFELMSVGTRNKEFLNAEIETKGNYYLAQGTVNDNISWILADTGRLYVEGTGKIPDYSSTKVKPWQEYIDLITEVVIGEGITRIGNQNFMGAKNLKTLTLPATVTSVGKYATYKTSLDTVYYSGSEEAFSLITTDSYNEPFNNSTVNYK